MENTTNKNCDSCKFCDFCSSCDYCENCKSCESCNSCESCKYCTNLKMTKYNYFCYADNRDVDGLQRPKYQVFNKQLTEDEYFNIDKIEMKLDLKNKTYKEAFVEAWNKLDILDKNKVTSLPGFNSKDFKKYYGVDINQVQEMTMKQVCEELGRNIKIIK